VCGEQAGVAGKFTSAVLIFCPSLRERVGQASIEDRRKLRAARCSKMTERIALLIDGDNCRARVDSQ
jgi:hypothetical protein